MFEIVNMLGEVQHQTVLDRIKADVNLSRRNLRTLIEAMELAGAGTAQTADIHDVPDVYAMDGAYQLKHALGRHAARHGEGGVMARGRGSRINDVSSMSTKWLKAALVSREVVELSGDYDDEFRATVLVPFRKAIEAELARREGGVR